MDDANTIAVCAVSAALILSEIMPVATRGRFQGFLHTGLLLGVKYGLVSENLLHGTELILNEDIDQNGHIGRDAADSA